MLVKEGIECLNDQDRSRRIQVLCESINNLLGADATDIWMVDKQNSSVDITNGGYFFAPRLQSKFPSLSPEEFLDKVSPRFDGITRRLADNRSDKLFFLPSALSDSQAAEGTRELDLKSVIGLQIREASSLNTDAILWIRFLRKPGVLCDQDDGSKLSETWEENLRTIANFVHIVVFHEQYEHLFEEAMAVTS